MTTTIMTVTIDVHRAEAIRAAMDPETPQDLPVDLATLTEEERGELARIDRGAGRPLCADDWEVYPDGARCLPSVEALRALLRSAIGRRTALERQRTEEAAREAAAEPARRAAIEAAQAAREARDAEREREHAERERARAAAAQAAEQRLREWALAHGSSLLRARLEGHYEWISLARTEFVAWVTPDGWGPPLDADLYEDRRSPTLDEIAAHQETQRLAAEHPEYYSEPRLIYSAGHTPQPDGTRHYVSVILTVTCPDGHEELIERHLSDLTV